FGLFEGADAATRKAEGRWLTDVWVPYKIAGAYQTGSLAPRIAFSKSQWDWEWVEKLETDGAALVEETLTLESLQAYSRQHGFEGAGELDDIQAATARLTGVSQRTLSQHPARKIPVVYLPALPDNS